MAETTDNVSSLPPARRSILRSKSTSDVSTTSVESKSSCITFAPLPEIAPRKRRNTRPLGMASRAEMLRKTRQQFDDAPMYDDHDGPPPDEEEIPLPDLGKLMKGLWRSVSRKDKGARTTTVSVDMKEGTIQEDGDGEGRVWMEQVDWPAQDTPAPPQPITTRDTNRDTTTCAGEYDGNTHLQPRIQDGLANG